MELTPQHLERLRTAGRILDKICGDLDQSHLDLEQVINSTPTGNIRNHLTEANIHLLEAVNKLDQVSTFFSLVKE